MTASDLAREINELLDADGRGSLMVLGLDAYRIGDDYEASCVGSALTVSREHIGDVVAHEGAIRAVTHFLAEQVPERYRSRVNDNGVVLIGIEIPVTDTVTLHVVDPDGRWRAQIAD